MKMEKNKCSIRNKCYTDALYNNELDNLSIEECRQLIGFIEPFNNNNKIVWTVSLIDKGSYFDCVIQSEAMILSRLEQLMFKKIFEE